MKTFVLILYNSERLAVVLGVKATYTTTLRLWLYHCGCWSGARIEEERESCEHNNAKERGWEFTIVWEQEQFYILDLFICVCAYGCMPMHTWTCVCGCHRSLEKGDEFWWHSYKQLWVSWHVCLGKSSAYLQELQDLLTTSKPLLKRNNLILTAWQRAQSSLGGPSWGPSWLWCPHPPTSTSGEYGITGLCACLNSC